MRPVIFEPLDIGSDSEKSFQALWILNGLMYYYDQPPLPEYVTNELTAEGQEYYCLRHALSEVVVATGALIHKTNQQSSLDVIAVKPEEQRKGYGRMLLGQLEVEARQKGAHVLRVAPLDEARPFYEKVDYVQDSACKYTMSKDLHACRKISV